MPTNFICFRLFVFISKSISIRYYNSKKTFLHSTSDPGFYIYVYFYIYYCLLYYIIIILYYFIYIFIYILYILVFKTFFITYVKEENLNATWKIKCHWKVLIKKEFRWLLASKSDTNYLEFLFMCCPKVNTGYLEVLYIRCLIMCFHKHQSFD
jgi:hypothetical protein